MDTSNKYMVGAASGGMVRVMLPPAGFITPEEALVFAAWLVEMAEMAPGSKLTFEAAREAVQNA